MSSSENEEKGPGIEVLKVSPQQTSQSEQDLELQIWILSVEEPQPRIDDFKEKAQEWFSLDLDNDPEARWPVMRWIRERTIIGPVVSDSGLDQLPW